MKNVFRLLVIAALAALFALPAFAQNTTGGAAAQASPCTADADAKAALYQSFLANYKGTPEQQKNASQIGKDYLAKYGTCPDEGDKKIASFIQNWVTKYDKVVVEFNFNEALKAKDYQKAFDLGRQILNNQPDNNTVLLSLVSAGHLNAVAGNAANKSLFSESVNYTRRALRAAEADKLGDLSAYKGKEGAIAFFNYTLAILLRDSSPKEATDALLKAVQSNSVYKTEPAAYYLLGSLYYNNEVKPKVAEYAAKYPAGSAETPESKAAFDAINEAIDRSIDAFARAVALSKDANQKKTFMDQLTAIYKSRHDNSDAGLQELVASVLSKPLPLPGQTPVPTSTPSSSSGTTGTDGNTPKPSTTPTQPTTTQPTTTPGSKPATPPQKPPVTKATPATRARAATTTSGR